MPLARALPNPVSTPRLPPQKKIMEIRRWLVRVNSQTLPSAKSLAQSGISRQSACILYGLPSMLTFSEPGMLIETYSVDPTAPASRIDQTFADIITHVFKTWRNMRNLCAEMQSDLEEGQSK